MTLNVMNEEVICHENPVERDSWPFTVEGSFRRREGAHVVD